MLPGPRWLTKILARWQQHDPQLPADDRRPEMPLTDRESPAPHYLREAIPCDEYEVTVEEAIEERLLDNGRSPPTELRTVRLHISMRNQSDHPLRYSNSQWKLYDAEGYSYDCQSRDLFFGEDATRKLGNGLISLGRQVRGWLAFEVEEGAEVEYVQFQPDYRARRHVDILLVSLPPDHPHTLQPGKQP